MDHQTLSSTLSPRYGADESNRGTFHAVLDSSDHSQHFEVGDDDESIREYAEGNSGFADTVFNFVNTIVGAGIIGLPYAILQCGFFLGLILMCVAAWLIDQSSIMLIVAGDRSKLLNYEELMGALFSGAGFHTFCFFAFVMAYGAMSAYLIIIGAFWHHSLHALQHSVCITNASNRASQTLVSCLQSIRRHSAAGSTSVWCTSRQLHC
jgi:amino acid permease